MPLMLKRWYVPAAIMVAGTSLFGLASFASDKPDTAVIAQNLSRSVAQNAQGWFFNHYDAGSLSNIRVIRPDGEHGLIVRATYTFNGGKPGWVMARIVGTQVECLQYWDKNGCEPVTGGRRYAATARTTAQGQGDNGEDFFHCMANTPDLVGQACKDAGVGVDADGHTDQPNEPSEPPQSEPAPASPEPDL